MGHLVRIYIAGITRYLYKEAITAIQTRRSGMLDGVLHAYQSVFKELDVFGSDLMEFNDS